MSESRVSIKLQPEWFWVFEFFVAGLVDLVLPAGKAVRRGDVADGRMQALVVIAVDKATAGAGQREDPRKGRH